MSIPIVDAHLDLASNAVFLNRDLCLSLDRLAEQERGMTDLLCRAHPTVTLPELRRAEVRLCCATLLARVRPEAHRAAGAPRADIDYASGEIAHALAVAQAAYYELLAERGELELIATRDDLAAHAACWTGGAGPAAGAEDASRAGRWPIGYILSMEGADPIVSPDAVGFWWERGLRVASLVHYGAARYAAGTGTDGGVTEDGRELLRAFDEVGMILDLTHLADRAFFEALDAFGGAVLASHNNCRALVPGDRQFTDEQIRRIVERGGVIGVACDAWMLYPGWQRGVTKPEVLSMASLVDHIDHICEVSGDARHAAIGSDLDGLFGWEQTPRDLRSIADLQKLADLLAARGYQQDQIEGIMYRNWLSYFTKNLPARA